MRTELLYLIDSELYSCKATVLECRQVDLEHYGVILDRTVFFPEKGGQPSDTGSIGSAEVIGCEEQYDELWHICTKELKVGSEVEVSINQGRRFDIMQQHTGEHILSFFAYEQFGAINVGFHCALDYATLDLNKPLTREQIETLEDFANIYACQNKAISARIYDSEEDMKDIELRKHSEGLSAPIRVVSMEDGDCCTCCAPHVKHTGEVGQIKVTDAMAYKGGMRLTFMCGLRALQHSQRLQYNMDKLARMFSTGQEQVPSAVTKQGEELSACKKELRQAIAKLDEYLAKELCHGASVVRGIQLIVTDVKGVDAKRLRSLAQNTLSGQSLTVLFAPWEDKVNYILMSKDLKKDMGELIAAVNAILNGKGGGRGELAQGSAKLSGDLLDTIAQLRHYFEKLLG